MRETSAKVQFHIDMEEPQQRFLNVENEKQAEFVEDQCLCVLCQTALQLKHDACRESQEIEETAFCPVCDIRTRRIVYSLH